MQCAPGPNLGVSKHKILKVIAPVTKPVEQRNIEQQNNKLGQEQKNHEKRQDQTNKTEKRDVKQQPPKGAENPDKTEQPDHKEPGGMGDPMTKPEGMGDPTMPPQGDPERESQNRAVQEAIKKAEQDKQAADVKPDPRQDQSAKVEPGAGAGAAEGGPAPGGGSHAENRPEHGHERRRRRGRIAARKHRQD